MHKSNIRKANNMPRRRFHAPPGAFNVAERRVTLTADESRHARDVLRLRAGDEVYVFDGAGNEFRCAVREFTRSGAVIDVQEQVEPARPESRLQLTLGLALLKGEKFGFVLQKTVELGVTRIVPLISERTDVRLKSSDDALRRWQRIAVEAAKQSGRAYVPEIASVVAVISFLPSIDADSGRFFFAERNGESFEDAIEECSNTSSRIAAAVGPEGGWSDEEIAQARHAGWNVVTLGGRTLRAETAAVAITTLLQHRFGDLK